MTHRFVVVARNHSAAVEIADDGSTAVTQFGEAQKEDRPGSIGSALWRLMNAAGITRAAINHFAIFERDTSGILVATIHPVLNGAHATWLVLYRADREGSVFRSLGNHHKVSDALNRAFSMVAEEVVLPHKP